MHSVLQFNLNTVQNNPDITAVNYGFGDDELFLHIIR
ncbi:hypothetical protein KLPMMM250M_22095 [Klebsiella pneumoniae]